jgi:hypothetical protein
MEEKTKTKKFTIWDYVVLFVLVIILFPFLLSVLEGLADKDYQALLINLSLSIFTIYGIIKYAQKLSVSIKTNKTTEPKEVFIETTDTKIKTDKLPTSKKLFALLKKYLAEIILIIGVCVLLYNLLEPQKTHYALSTYMKPQHASTELIILGVVLAIISIDIAIRRYIANKNK